jgi:DNA-binding MarR family transcriptional regulator
MPQTWGFLTNHALVLVYVVRHNGATVREIAGGVGVTERATLAILRQLSDDGIVDRRRDGRRTTYTVNFERMAAYRRIGTIALTPREFVDGMIRALLAISGYHGRNGAAADAQVLDSGALDPQVGTWGFFTNHALLLLSISMDNGSTVRDMAQAVGVTERAVVAILNQLEDEKIILRRKQGRRNSYAIDFDELHAFPRWSPGEWPLPPELVDMAVSGLRALAARSATDGAGHEDATVVPLNRVEGGRSRETAMSRR